MSIDLLALEPTVVSRDLRGKIVMFYGEPKSGKTSNAVKFPKHLLLAFEKGYNAINNVMAQPINKWSEFKRVLRQLSDDKLKEKFETIIIDTCDIAWDLCEEYICNREGVDTIGDIPYGAGYSMLRKEFDQALRSIPLMDYGLVMISHSQDKQFTDENGDSFQKIVPTLQKNAEIIVNRMADIIGYSRNVDTDDGTEVLLYMRGTPRFTAGSRWKNTPDYIPFTYEALVNAIAEAIEKQEEEDGVVATDEHVNIYKQEEGLTFEETHEQIGEIIDGLLDVEDNEENIEKIQAIVEVHLGKGRKIADTTPDQIQMLSLILDDLKELQ